MVVDHSVVQRQFCKVLLGFDDYDVVSFGNASAVGDYLATRPVNLVIVDLNISQGGLDLCRMIRTEYQLPVVLVGEIADHPTRQQAEVCADVFITKPLIGKGLRQVVKRYLG